MIRKMVCSLGAVLVLASGVANADTVLFTVSMDEAQAFVCAGTGSVATGSGTLSLDTVTNIVSYNIKLSGLEGTEEFAHVHGPGAECGFGDVNYDLPLGSPKVGTQSISAGQAQAMVDGLHYILIHTSIFPFGEIRGQILPVVPEVPTISTWGLAATALLVLSAGTITFNRRRRLTT